VAIILSILKCVFYCCHLSGVPSRRRSVAHQQPCYIISALTLSCRHSPDLSVFTPASESEVHKMILSNCPNKQSDSDPIPTWLLKECSSVLVPTIILLVFHHSFIPGLKPSFSANPSHRSLFFSSPGLTTWIPQTVYFWAYPFLLFSFSVLHFL